MELGTVEPGAVELGTVEPGTVELGTVEPGAEVVGSVEGFSFSVLVDVIDLKLLYLAIFNVTLHEPLEPILKVIRVRTHEPTFDQFFFPLEFEVATSTKLTTCWAERVDTFQLTRVADDADTNSLGIGIITEVKKHRPRSGTLAKHRRTFTQLTYFSRLDPVSSLQKLYGIGKPCRLKDHALTVTKPIEPHTTEVLHRQFT